MTPRASEISAFITPFGLFQWIRMPFGLRNAPQIYQRHIDNALYGFSKITIKNGEWKFEKVEDHSEISGTEIPSLDCTDHLKLRPEDELKETVAEVNVLPAILQEEQIDVFTTGSLDQARSYP